MSDYKQRVQAALDKFAKKDLKEIDRIQGRGKKNQKPEKAVEKECLEWMRAQGFVVEIYDSKATLKDGVWRNQGLRAGHADCAGTNREGIAIYVEFKAPGKLSTFNHDKNKRQQDFIMSRIEMNCFAVVTDSVDRLKSIYMKWSELRAKSLDDAKNYLLDCLP